MIPAMLSQKTMYNMLPSSSPTRVANDQSIHHFQQPAKDNVRVQIHTPVKYKKWKGISLTLCYNPHWMKTLSSTPLPKHERC